PRPCCVRRAGLAAGCLEIHVDAAGRRLDGERVLGPVHAEVIEQRGEAAQPVANAGVGQTGRQLVGRGVGVAVDVDHHQAGPAEVQRRVAAGGVLPTRGGQVHIGGGRVECVAGGLGGREAGAPATVRSGALPCAAAVAVAAGCVGFGCLGVGGPSSAGEVDGYLC